MPNFFEEQVETTQQYFKGGPDGSGFTTGLELSKQTLINSTINPIKDSLSSLNPANIVDQARVGLTNSAQHYINEAAQLLPGRIRQDPRPPIKTVSFRLLDTQYNPAPVNTVQAAGFSKPGFQFEMSVNPASWAIAYPQRTVTPVRTLGGWQLQYWFPEMGSITGNGIIGQLLKAFNDVSFKNSIDWNNFNNLLQIYLYNGVGYRTKGPGGSFNTSRNNPNFFPIVECIYDGYIYYGYFESFTLTETEDQPFTRSYDFSFKYFDSLDISNLIGLTSEG